MADFDKRALSAQLNADPRVRQWVQQMYPNGSRGASAGPPEDLLRQWGYQIPPGYNVSAQAGRVQVYDTHDKWDTILPVAGGGLLAAGAAGLAGAGPLASASSASGAAEGVAATERAVSSPRPGGMSIPSPGGAASLGGSLTDFFTDPSNIAGLGALVAGLAGGRGGGSDPSATDEARRIQAITEARMRRVDPLQQAVTQLAWGRLPTSARQGIAPPTFTPLP